MPETRAVVSVIKLMATISYFTWAQPPSVCAAQVRFIVSWVKTNGHSPRATRARTDHWAVGPSTLSELPAEASEQENWAKNCSQVTVSWFDVSLVFSPLDNKRDSDEINLWCDKALYVCCFHWSNLSNTIDCSRVLAGSFAQMHYLAA